ncbi:SDR family NAD(P)-dependent oxidoreductase [uncultured Jatrophihabitans sp.]|uniref:SDR family NAD(P)-dependent oxidoreductase n=1 Tax=uncultured Jatrophihabitans sp. TaxID=1610747 RepID=UPI0035CA3ACB
MTPRVVCVTGASQGVGLAAAVAFAKAGDIVVATSRDATAARAAVRALDASIDVRPLDVTDQDSVDAFAAYVTDRHGRVDVVVNNAGRGFLGSTPQLGLDHFQDSLEVNFLGAMRVTKSFLPLMRRRRSGHLIAVSSIGGAVGQPFRDAYCAAKFALEGAYESMHPVLARFGIRVSIVEPGPVSSGFTARAVQLDPGADTELAALQRRYQAAAAAARGQSAEDAAAAVLACADHDDPPLRAQTSRFATRLVGLKLADVDGRAVSAMTGSWLAGNPDASDGR